MIPKTFILLLAILVACSYAAAPISAKQISTPQSVEGDLDLDLGEDESLDPYTLPLMVERYLKEENIEFEPDSMLDVEDGYSEGIDDKLVERDIVDKAKIVCYKIKYAACKIKKFCCCKFKKSKRKKCRRKCKRKAKKKCGIKD